MARHQCDGHPPPLPKGTLRMDQPANFPHGFDPNLRAIWRKIKNRVLRGGQKPSEEASFGFSSLFDSLFNYISLLGQKTPKFEASSTNPFLPFATSPISDTPTNSQQVFTVSWIWFGLRWALKILNGVGPGQAKALWPWQQRGGKRMTLHRPWRQAFSESTLPFRPSIALSIRLGLPRTRSSSVKSCEFFWVFFFFCSRGIWGRF